MGLWTPGGTGRYIKKYKVVCWLIGLIGLIGLIMFVGQDAMGHAIGDWNNDGFMDWFSSAIFHNMTECTVSGCTFGSGGNRLYRNLGKKSFDDATDLVSALQEI